MNFDVHLAFLKKSATVEGTFFVLFWNTSECADAKKNAKY
jgi:hypothetical protein